MSIKKKLHVVLQSSELKRIIVPQRIYHSSKYSSILLQKSTKNSVKVNNINKKDYSIKLSPQKNNLESMLMIKYLHFLYNVFS